MENHDLISVIIPVHNCDRYLAQAIESVLAQTYKPIEIIVIDDGSTDSSAEVAKRFESSVRYYYQPQSGAGTARNYGTELAQGRFFAFLDSDDLWVKDKLSCQVAALENNPELDVVFGLVQQFISPELDESIKNTIQCSSELMAGYVAGTMLIKRDAFFRVGLFETNWQMGEFIDWYIKATEQGLNSLMLQKTVLERRLHKTNMGIRDRQHRTDYARILKASLDRRRAKSQST